MWSIQSYLKDMISLQWIHVIYNYIYKYDQRCIQLYDELGWYLYRAHKIKLDCILSWGLSMGSAHLLQWLVIRHFQRAVTVVLFYSFFGEGWRLDLLQDLAQFSHWEIPLFGESMLRCFFLLGPSTQLQDWEIFQGTDAFWKRPVLSVTRSRGERNCSKWWTLCTLEAPGFRGRIPWGGSLRVSIVRETPVAVESEQLWWILGARPNSQVVYHPNLLLSYPLVI